MNTINIDGTVYEKIEVKNWEVKLDPEGLYVIHLKIMYELKKVLDKSIEEKEIGYKADI